jgi:hypothetical protein
VATFTKAFNVTSGHRHYVPNAAVISVDVATRNVKHDLRAISRRYAQHHSSASRRRIVADAGLANDAARQVRRRQCAFVRVDHSLLSTSSVTPPRPRSQAGHIATEEAKVCADAIVRMFAAAPDPSPVTNSACYSPITATTASWLTAVFAYDPVTKTMVPVPASSGEATGPSGDHYEDMFLWFSTLMKDSFA